jgi:serine/threonine protein kinase, bacterial
MNDDRHGRTQDEVEDPRISAPAAAQPAVTVAAAPHRRVSLAAKLVPPVLVAMALAASGFAATQLMRSDPQPNRPPQWQPYVDFGKSFAEHLMSLSPQTVDSDLDRIVSESTGQFQKDFSSQREDFKKTALDSAVTTTATTNAAALAAIDKDRQTAEVLVSATSKVTNSAGSNQEPTSWRLQLTVEKLGDTYKASKVEFVP